MQVEVLGSEAFSTDYSRGVMSAWEQFMVTGDCEPIAVRNVIKNSWARCRSGQVPASATQAPIVACGDNLELLRTCHHDVLTAAAEVTASLSQVLVSSRSVLLITDPQGVILDAYGDQQTLEAGAQRHIAPGGCWSENVSGTNAIGTAIAAGDPVQVHAIEHFCEGVKTWTCSAALIRDTINNDILGVVDLSGFDETFNVHSLALAISTANSIEAILKGREARDRIHLLQWCNEEASSWNNDGLIILDSKGRVVSMNKNAARHLRSMTVEPAAGHVLPGRTASFGIIPEWVKPECVHPVTVGGKNLGTILVLPTHQECKAPGPAQQSTTAKHSRDDASGPFSRIVGASQAIRAAVMRAHRLASGSFPVLILGETGTGKEEFSRAIHDASSVKGGPFVALNCGALAKELVASELFGYVEGAFTGARRGGRAGKFEEADGGTLFLDEVGELPLDAQAQLLRVLQDGIVTRIGENKARRLTVRILSATNRDLRAAVERGSFREDLYYRLAATSLSLPPLRLRQCDIGLLAEYFLERLNASGNGTAKIMAATLLETLSRHNWPGNIRELRNVIEVMWHVSEHSVLTPDDLPAEYRISAPRKSEGGTGVGRSLSGLKATEREVILAAIAENNGNLRKVAQQLGIARSTLYERLRSYGVSLSRKVI